MNNILTTQETKWYYKIPFIIFACIMFYPLGLFLLWKSVYIKTGWKAFFTVFIAFYGLTLTVATFTSPETPETIAHKKHMDSLAKAEQAIDDSIEIQKKQKGIEEKQQKYNLAHIEQLRRDSIEADKNQRSIALKKQKEIEEANRIEMAKEPRLINSIDELKQRFNDYAASLTGDFDFRINDIKIEHGDANKGEVKNSFRYVFNDNIVWVGVLNKSDNSITSIIMVCTGDGSYAGAGNILYMMGGIITAADPSIPKEHIKDIFKRLGMFRKGKKANMDTHIVQNGIKYYLIVSPEMIWFGAEIDDLKQD